LTEPDPVAALAEQLEELRRQLAVYTGETGHLRARLEEDSGQVLMLHLEIKKLGEKLDEAIARRQAAGPPAPFWLGLSKEEHAARLAEVRAWVERVAASQWPGYMSRLAPCWPNHPEAVQELSNLMTEWARIYADPDNRPLQDALWFFERWLPGVLGRLAAAVKCDVAGCRLAGRSPWERSPPRYT
jgi:regulator of replication initiation timing